MNGYNFTERVRKVLMLAREEAAQRQQGYVSTEHILLGIVREGESVAAAVLHTHNVDFDALRRDVEAAAGQGTTSQVHGSDLPYSSLAKKSLELAMAEASELRHIYLGCEHLLLGLLREGTSPSATLLVQLGVTIGSARTETLRLLGSEAPPTAPTAANDATVTAGASAPAMRNITIEMRFDDGSVRREDFMSVEAATRYLNQH
jgi:ATP-dependent Clp protease ATP-binding subunit ClpC